MTIMWIILLLSTILMVQGRMGHPQFRRANQGRNSMVKTQDDMISRSTRTNNDNQHFRSQNTRRLSSKSSKSSKNGKSRRFSCRSKSKSKSSKSKSSKSRSQSYDNECSDTEAPTSITSPAPSSTPSPSNTPLSPTPITNITSVPPKNLTFMPTQAPTSKDNNRTTPDGANNPDETITPSTMAPGGGGSSTMASTSITTLPPFVPGITTPPATTVPPNANLPGGTFPPFNIPSTTLVPNTNPPNNNITTPGRNNLTLPPLTIPPVGNTTIGPSMVAPGGSNTAGDNATVAPTLLTIAPTMRNGTDATAAPNATAGPTAPGNNNTQTPSQNITFAPSGNNTTTAPVGNATSAPTGTTAPNSNSSQLFPTNPTESSSNQTTFAPIQPETPITGTAPPLIPRETNAPTNAQRTGAWGTGGMVSFKNLTFDAQLEITFFEGQGRAPTVNEVNALINETELFFKDVFTSTLVTENSFQTFTISHVEQSYNDTDNADFFQVTFDATLVVAAGSAVTMETVASVVNNADFNDYISAYVWMSEPFQRNEFYQTHQVKFTCHPLGVQIQRRLMR